MLPKLSEQLQSRIQNMSDAMGRMQSELSEMHAAIQTASSAGSQVAAAAAAADATAPDGSSSRVSRASRVAPSDSASRASRASRATVPMVAVAPEVPIADHMSTVSRVTVSGSGAAPADVPALPVWCEDLPASTVSRASRASRLSFVQK
jgi:alkylation response protein AidB-like acyl-CoA dehydrogenase